MNEQIKYTQEDYWTLLLIYAANVDLEIHKLEEEFIIKRFGQETYDKMRALFQNQSDYETIQWLMSHKSEFIKTEEKKNKMIASIANLFAADGHVDFMERNMSMMINKILK